MGLTDYCLLFSGFRSGLLQRYFLEFLQDFPLDSFWVFSRIVPRISLENPLKIILDLLFGGIPSEILEKKSISPSFPSVFCRSRDSPGFEPGVLSGIPFGVSSEFFLEISPNSQNSFWSSLLQEFLSVLLHLFLASFLLKSSIVRYLGR